MKASKWLSRRALIRACICLLLGAVINVAVAWGCVCWSPLRERGREEVGEWAAPVPADWSHGRVRVVSLMDGFGLTTTWCWSTTYPVRRQQWVLSAGWPMRGMFFERHAAEDILNGGFPIPLQFHKSSNWTEGLKIPEWLRPRDGGVARFLPAQPIWSGFVIDTLLYASLPWCIALGFGRWRRRRCIRLHLCPECGYDLRGNVSEVCPECGAKREVEQ